MRDFFTKYPLATGLLALGVGFVIADWYSKFKIEGRYKSLGQTGVLKDANSALIINKNWGIFKTNITPMSSASIQPNK